MTANEAVELSHIVSEIGKADEAIKTCYERVEVLERKLEENKLPLEKRKLIEKELAEVRKLLQTNKQLLSKLHNHNRQSFMLAIFLAFICFTLYMIYVLIIGLDF